jgi:predicted XRE-type DNA-binding protein
VIFVENVEIRSAYMQAGIKQWKLAEALGISETHFSRKLRKELPQEEKEKILETIHRLAQEKQEAI